jgi:RNA polymerase sporulation-specific sigma factor
MEKANHNERSDEELAGMYGILADESNEIFRELERRYRKLVYFKASRFFAPGAQLEDFRQEALIGLYKAVVRYDGDKGMSFTGFAILCMDSALKSALRRYLGFRHEALNNALALDDVVETRANPFGVGAYGVDAEKTALINEMLAQVNEVAVSALSRLEREVFFERISGASYEDMCEKYGKSQKTIDNAIQRARKKIVLFVNPEMKLHGLLGARS